MKRLAGLVMLAVLCITLRGAGAFGQNPPPSGEACGDRVARWVARCNSVRQASINIVECPASGLFILQTSAVRVEVARDAARGFRRAGGWGLSPVGFSGAWDTFPAAQRESFERVVACVQEDATLPSTVGGDGGGDWGADDHAIHGTRTDHEDHTRDGGTDDQAINPTRTDHEDHTGDGGTDDHAIHGTRTDHEDRTGRGGTDRRGDSTGGGGIDRREGHGPRTADHARWGEAPRDRARARMLAHLPWRLLLGGALLAWVWWPRRKRPRSRVKVAVALGLSGAIVAARWAVLTPTFFHQNGQGAIWIDAALRGMRPYGPGYSEMFDAVLGIAPAHPEYAIFLAQSTLAAAALCAAWGLARRSGVSSEAASPVAAALAVGMAVNPTLGRIALSESYFATCLSLDLIAAWALTLGRWPRGGRDAKLRALAPTVAGGMLLSLAVAVHPVSWLPSAMVPLVLLVGPGSYRRRLRRTVLAYAVVGAVVAVTALPGVLSVLHGELGQSWVGNRHGHSMMSFYPDKILRALSPWLGGLVVLLATVRRPTRLLPRMLVCFAVVAVASMTDVVTPSGTRAVVSWAFYAQHLPVILAVFAAALSDLPRARAHAVALGVLLALGGVALAARSYRSSVEMPTDARELTALLAWRDRLPAGASVTSLARAGRHVLAFPLYPSIDPRGRHLSELRVADGLMPTLRGTDTYWYHSSLCSTVEGRPYCNAIERGLSLEPVATAVFPAMWSLSHLPYDAARVPVGLYRVRGSTAR